MKYFLHGEIDGKKPLPINKVSIEEVLPDE